MAFKFKKTLVASCPGVLSENEWIAAKVCYTKFKKPFPIVYKTPKAKFYQKVLISQYSQQLTKEELSKLKLIPRPKVILNTQFLLNRDTRDVTNLCKLYEDALKVALGVDDKYTTDHYMSKSVIKSLTREYIVSEILILSEDPDEEYTITTE